MTPEATGSETDARGGDPGGLAGTRARPDLPRSARVVAVRAGAGALDYPVLVGSGLVEALPDILDEHLGAHRYALIADSTVADLHGRDVLVRLREAGLTADLFTFPPGEANKTRATWSALTDALLAAGFGRDGALVALGGGVTGDLTGFVAATYLRGVPVAQIPTSLVAMVDAAVGGKTGVDVPAGKNLVGAFHPPRVVVADTAIAATLPRGERAQGLVEAVKHGAVLDVDYLAGLERDAEFLLDGDIAATTDVVLRSVEIKADVVGRDEREAGVRQVLNFGHTLGHALEAAAGYGVAHGTAVGIGMVLEARLGETLGVTRGGTAERLARNVVRLGLPLSLPAPPAAEEIVRFTRTDKKGREGRSRYVLLASAGVVSSEGGWSRTVPDDAVMEILRSWCRQGSI